MVIAYLTGEYGRASDTFIREEVGVLRDLGHRVHTFSVRRPLEAPVDEAVAAERDGTDYVLTHGLAALARHAGRGLGANPGRFADAAALAARIGSPGARGRLWPAAYLLEAAYLASRLEDLRVDHLHDHIAEGSASVAMLASSMSGVPFSLTVHGPEEFDRAPALALDVKVRRAAFAAAITDHARAQLLRWVDPPDWPKVEIIRCGVARGLLDGEPSRTPDSRRLVSVGRLEAAKGHLVLVEAVARLLGDGEEPFEVEIVGDGPLRRALEQRIRSLGVEGAVTLRGALGHREVTAMISESRALVMPSFAEGLPVTIMEAFALGRPVIATPVGGIPELVSPGENGWLPAPGSADALAAAMREVLGAPTRGLNRMGRAGRALVAERHDPRRSTARLAELFAEAASARSRP